MQRGSITTRPVTVIEPRRGWLALGLRELWQYRELAAFFVWRDVKVRYKQTLIGAGWAVLQPLVLMVIFTVIFGRARGLQPPRGVPTPVFYFSALLPWTYFAHALQVSTGSVLSAQTIITRVYFPRLLLPLSGVLPGLLDFSMSLGVLFVLMVAYGVGFSVTLLAIPVLLFLTALTAFGAGTWLSATNALYRDIREGVPFIVQIMLFTSPVLLPASRIPDWLRPYYELNPIAGIIEGFRWAIVGHPEFPWEMLAKGTAVSVLLTLFGLIYFRRIEDIIVDVV